MPEWLFLIIIALVWMANSIMDYPDKWPKGIGPFVNPMLAILLGIILIYAARDLIFN